MKESKAERKARLSSIDIGSKEFKNLKGSERNAARMFQAVRNKGQRVSNDIVEAIRQSEELQKIPKASRTDFSKDLNLQIEDFKEFVKTLKVEKLYSVPNIVDLHKTKIKRYRVGDEILNEKEFKDRITEVTGTSQTGMIWANMTTDLKTNIATVNELIIYFNGGAWYVDLETGETERVNK